MNAKRPLRMRWRNQKTIYNGGRNAILTIIQMYLKLGSLFTVYVFGLLCLKFH